MSATKTGGPAFPVPGLHQDSDFNGMTLRDYFAAKIACGDAAADRGWMSYPKNEDAAKEYEKVIAERAALFYRIADAMLAERAK